MAAERLVTNTQWLARVALVLALGAVQVALTAACGLGVARVAVIAVATAAFVIAYLVMPSPSNRDDGAETVRPIHVMRGAALVAVAATGGWTSPLLPLLAVPVAIAWTLAPPRRADLVVLALTVAVLVAVSAFAPPAAAVTPGELAALAGWSTIVTTWAIGRRIALLRDLQRSQAACMSRLREGALVDAESRRRGMELMTTKLAHELKNPLAAIKSLAQVEAAHAGDPKSRRRLEVVLGEVDRIGTLLREYLDVARPIVEAAVAPLELDDLMSDVSTLVTGRAEAAGVALAVEGHGGALRADGRLLKEAIVNVVCNAIEATPRGGQVTVRYDVGDRGVHIEVRDTGRGMSKETAARIGTPFFTTRDGGTGLGVVIAKTALAQHGGTLDYQSTLGAGTIARIALPAEPCPSKRATA